MVMAWGESERRVNSILSRFTKKNATTVRRNETEIWTRQFVFLQIETERTGPADPGSGLWTLREYIPMRSDRK
jgi:hypothetical protein